MPLPPRHQILRYTKEEQIVEIQSVAKTQDSGLRTQNPGLSIYSGPQGDNRPTLDYATIRLRTTEYRLTGNAGAIDSHTALTANRKQDGQRQRGSIHHSPAVLLTTGGCNIKTIVLFTLIISFWPTPSQAQSDLYGTRLVGRHGWRLPVATRHLGSDAPDHLARGSVSAIDLIAPYRSAVYALAPGKVIVANCGNAGGYGCWVMIDHQTGYSSLYGHCDTGTLRVRVGQAVTANTILCLLGWTGITSFGPHTHLEIHCRCSPTGRIDPLTIWPRTAFFYEKLGAARSKTPVGARWYQTVSSDAGIILRNATLNQAWLVAIGLLTLLWLCWSPRPPIPNGAYHGAFLALAVVVMPYLPLLLTAPPVDGVTNDALPAAQKFAVAYALTRKWEGARCVHDPVRTYKGITNGTYNAWRMSQNLGPGDVCRDLTEPQAKSIYYNRYWLPSGAGALTLKLAITHFDFAINAGVGAAHEALLTSRGNPAAYNRYRRQFYLSAKLCSLYCPGWLNRLRDIRRYSE